MIFAALAFFMLSPGNGTPVTIQNPTFQSEPFLTGWEVEFRARSEHGRRPTFTVDRNNAKEGS